MLRRLWSRLRPLPTDGKAVPPRIGPRLRSAEGIVGRWRERGGSAATALELACDQVEGLQACVGDDAQWQRLRALVARTGDPWNADDWPAGFDPLLLCAPLCRRVAFECRTCPVGRAQQDRSCADPSTRIAAVLTLVQRGDRSGLIEHLAELRAHLGTLE